MLFRCTIYDGGTDLNKGRPVLVNVDQILSIEPGHGHNSPATVFLTKEKHYLIEAADFDRIVSELESR